MVFYFTATGNSLYVARELDTNTVSIAQAVHDREHTYSDDTIGIVCPIFGHEMPELVKDFLAQSTFETDYFYVILTYGNRHANAAELAAEFLGEHGIHADYVNQILMADNFLPNFDMAEQRTMDKDADGQIDRIRQDIQGRVPFIAPTSEKDREAHQEHLTRMSHMPADAFRRLYRITDACVGCGICTQVCPKACYHLEGKMSVWNPDGCIVCMACVHACPTLAIQLNMPEKNPQERYRNDNVRLTDIIEANCQKTVDR